MARVVFALLFALSAVSSTNALGVANGRGTAIFDRSVNMALTAALTEDGYQAVASLRSDEVMKVFVRRVVGSLGRRVQDEGFLSGFVQHYSGTVAVQDMDRMIKELKESTWTETIPSAPVSAADETKAKDSDSNKATEDETEEEDSDSSEATEDETEEEDSDSSEATEDETEEEEEEDSDSSEATQLANATRKAGKEANEKAGYKVVSYLADRSWARWGTLIPSTLSSTIAAAAKKTVQKLMPVATKPEDAVAEKHVAPEAKVASEWVRTPTQTPAKSTETAAKLGRAGAVQESVKVTKHDDAIIDHPMVAEATSYSRTKNETPKKPSSAPSPKQVLGKAPHETEDAVAKKHVASEAKVAPKGERTPTKTPAKSNGTAYGLGRAGVVQDSRAKKAMPKKFSSAPYPKQVPGKAPHETEDAVAKKHVAPEAKVAPKGERTPTKTPAKSTETADKLGRAGAVQESVKVTKHEDAIETEDAVAEKHVAPEAKVASEWGRKTTETPTKSTETAAKLGNAGAVQESVTKHEDAIIDHPMVAEATSDSRTKNETPKKPSSAPSSKQVLDKAPHESEDAVAKKHVAPEAKVASEWGQTPTEPHAKSTETADKLGRAGAVQESVNVIKHEDAADAANESVSVGQLNNEVKAADTKGKSAAATANTVAGPEPASKAERKSAKQVSQSTSIAGIGKKSAADNVTASTHNVNRSVAAEARTVDGAKMATLEKASAKANAVANAKRLLAQDAAATKVKVQDEVPLSALKRREARLAQVRKTRQEAKAARLAVMKAKWAERRAKAERAANHTFALKQEAKLAVDKVFDLARAARPELAMAAAPLPGSRASAAIALAERVTHAASRRHSASNALLPDVDVLVAGTKAKVDEFTIRATKVRNQAADKFAAGEAELQSLRAEFKEKLEQKEIENQAIGSTNAAIRATIVAVKRQRADKYTEVSKFRSMAKVLTQALDALQPRLSLADDFVDASMNATDDSNATSLEVLRPTTPAPTLDHFLDLARKDLGLAEEHADDVSMMQLGSATRARTPVLDKHTNPGTITEVLAAKLRKLDEHKEKATAEMKRDYGELLRTVDARQSSLLHEQRSLNTTLAALDRQQPKLDAAVQHLQGRYETLKLRLETFRTFAGKVDQSLAEATAKADAEAAGALDQPKMSLVAPSARQRRGGRHFLRRAA